MQPQEPEFTRFTNHEAALTDEAPEVRCTARLFQTVIPDKMTTWLHAEMARSTPPSAVISALVAMSAAQVASVLLSSGLPVEKHAQASGDLGSLFGETLAKSLASEGHATEINDEAAIAAGDALAAETPEVRAAAKAEAAGFVLTEKVQVSTDDPAKAIEMMLDAGTPGAAMMARLYATEAPEKVMDWMRAELRERRNPQVIVGVLSGMFSTPMAALLGVLEPGIHDRAVEMAIANIRVGVASLVPLYQQTYAENAAKARAEAKV